MSLHGHLIDVKSFTYKWTIERFASQGFYGNYSISPEFPQDAASKNIPKWQLKVLRNNYNNKCYLTLYIYLLNEPSVGAKFQLSVVNKKGGKLKILETTTLVFKQNDSHYFENFLPLDVLRINEFLPEDKLTILCECSVALERKNVSIETHHAHFPNLGYNMSEDFESLLDDEEYSDVTLAAAGGEELKAHTCVLIARSKVFAAMLKHEMEEQRLQRINIIDVERNVLKEMLRYMYTNKVANLDTMAEDLLVVADKYALDNLKMMCEECLRSRITIEKAADILILADRHTAKQLKRAAMDFIINNASCVVETEGWKDMITSHAHLIAETFCILAVGPFK